MVAPSSPLPLRLPENVDAIQHVQSHSPSLLSTAHSRNSNASAVTLAPNTVDLNVHPARQESKKSENLVDSNRVVWETNDPENPQSWSVAYKWMLTIFCSLLTVNATFASSAPSSATEAVIKHFGVSFEVATLLTSLFLLGYVAGPLIWAPLSELIGRRPVFIGTMFSYTSLQLGEALSHTNIQTVLAIRFLSGLVASAPLTNCGGVLADIWDPYRRAQAISIFTASAFIGPALGPLIGSFIVESFLGFRWIFWLMMILGGTFSVLIIIGLPETYAPVLLSKRARRRRLEEDRPELYSDHEKADFSIKGVFRRTILRPFLMLRHEPILVLITIYLSIVYGLLYALFEAFPIIWGDLRGFNNVQLGLLFIGVGIGSLSGAVISIFLQRPLKVLVPKWHGYPPCEVHLYASMLAGPFLVCGILWLGWTGAYASVPWWIPSLSTVFLGASFTLVFISSQAYLIDVYLMYSASALAANTICRSAVGAAFPLFTRQMFNGLGIQWAATLIGGVSLLVSPSPFIFYKYGAQIRARSKFAPNLDAGLKAQVESEEQEALQTEGKFNQEMTRRQERISNSV